MTEKDEIFNNKIIRDSSSNQNLRQNSVKNTFGNYIDDHSMRYMTSDEKDFKIKLLANDLQIRDEKINVLDIGLREASDEITTLNRTISKLMAQFEEERFDKDKNHKKRANKLEKYVKEMDEHIGRLTQEISNRDEKYKSKLEKNKKTQIKEKNSQDSIKIEYVHFSQK